MSGTGSVNLQQLNLGYQSGVTSVVNLNGGTLELFAETGGAGGSADLGTSTFNFNGGILEAGAGFTAPTAVTTVVQSGGAFVNTNTFNMTIPTPLTNGGGGGGLTKSGLGTLTLSSANAYTGGTTLQRRHARGRRLIGDHRQRRDSSDHQRRDGHRPRHRQRRYARPEHV